MLPTTITLNVGSPAADLVFTREPGNVGNQARFFAPSPNNDLAGRPSLVIEHRDNGKGLVSSKVQFRTPVQDAESGEYTSYLQATTTLVRPSSADLDDVDQILEQIQEVHAVTDVRSSIGEASY